MHFTRDGNKNAHYPAFKPKVMGTPKLVHRSVFTKILKITGLKLTLSQLFSKNKTSPPYFLKMMSFCHDVTGGSNFVPLLDFNAG